MIMTYIKPSNYKDRPIAIVGAGTLGMRIALMMATQADEVRLFDTSVDQLAKAQAFIAEQLPALRGTSADSQSRTIVSCSDLTSALDATWLVFEAIPEVLKMKQDLFKQLDQLAPDDAILASNSSSIPSSQLISNVSEARRSLIINTHFYMPPMINVVEVMGSSFTDQGVIDVLMESLPQYAGLMPFLVRKESVGFIFNRVWAAIKRECLEVVNEEISTPNDIDLIWSALTGVKQGPFAQMDRVGLDVILAIEEHYTTIDPHLGTGALKLLKKYVTKGNLGVKTGRGFYEY